MTTDLVLPSERAPQPPTTIAGVIAQLRPEIARALPRGIDADRIARLALTCVRKDRNLALCTAESFAGALLTAAALGLEPGLNGEAYLVAYKDKRRNVTEATLIVGYQGYAKLFWQHPSAQHLDAQAVYEADDFDYALGTAPFLRHRPATGNRGNVIAYYAVAGLKGGATPFVVLSPDEVRALRGGKEGPSGQIEDPQRWMERKTVLRQLFKLTPKSTTLQQAIDSDERPGTELHAERIAERDDGPAGEHLATPETLPAPHAIPTDAQPEPEPEVVEDVRRITTAQSKMLNALLTDNELGDRNTGLGYISHVIGREVGTSKDLTKAEASAVIDSLQPRQVITIGQENAS